MKDRLGPHKAKRSSGKGKLISSTFGESWLKSTEDKL